MLFCATVVATGRLVLRYRVTLPALHLFYGDLNCPFCYALSEQIHEMGLDERVTWRGIQHLVTQEQWHADTPQHLSDEVRRVKARVKGLQITLPPLRPTTRLPTYMLIEATRDDPAAAAELRVALYRALWIEGRDIGSAIVLGEVCRDVGLRYRRETPVTRATALSWQSEWESLDRKIPILVAPTGARSSGLAESRRTAAFLRAGLLSSTTGDTCG